MRKLITEADPHVIASFGIGHLPALKSDLNCAAVTDDVNH